MSFAGDFAPFALPHPLLRPRILPLEEILHLFFLSGTCCKKLNFVLIWTCSGPKISQIQVSNCLWLHSFCRCRHWEHIVWDKCGTALGGGWVTLLGHNVLSSLAIWVVSWQSDRCNELNGLALVVSRHSAHITKPPPKLGLCQWFALLFADRMQCLDYSSDVKIRNLVGVSNICVSSSTCCLNGFGISFQSKSVLSSFQKWSFPYSPGQPYFHERHGTDLLYKCVDSLLLGFAEWLCLVAFCVGVTILQRHGQRAFSLLVASQIGKGISIVKSHCF